eukprot:6584606-Prymnesium_polylepis.1
MGLGRGNRHGSPPLLINSKVGDGRPTIRSKSPRTPKAEPELVFWSIETRLVTLPSSGVPPHS